MPEQTGGIYDSQTISITILLFLLLAKIKCVRAIVYMHEFYGQMVENSYNFPYFNHQINSTKSNESRNKKLRQQSFHENKDTFVALCMWSVRTKRLHAVLCIARCKCKCFSIRLTLKNCYVMMYIFIVQLSFSVFTK